MESYVSFQFNISQGGDENLKNIINIVCGTKTFSTYYTRLSVDTRATSWAKN